MRFSTTGIFGKISRFSGTSARPLSKRSYGCIPRIFSPRKVMDPVAFLFKPTIVSTVVVFPAPFGPIRVTSSPLFTCRERSQTTWRFAWNTFSPETDSMGAKFSEGMHVSEVGIDHFLVVHYFIWVPFCNLFPMVQHNNAVRNAHDNTHNVFDDQDRNAIIADFFYKLDCFVTLLRVKPGSQFIQQEQFWF